MKQKSNHNIVLVIDDQVNNLNIIFQALQETGIETTTARNGKNGLRRARFIQPDLILLDVMMPDINGFEVCAALKAKESTKDIPVIFMTAISETVHKIKGFELGAVDYITKPLVPAEVVARVNTHLDIYNLQRRYQKQLARLQTSQTATLNPADYELNERELKVLSLFAAGVKRGEIAEEMIVTQNTIRWYLKNIYAKLAVNSRAEAIAKAREMGL